MFGHIVLLIYRSFLRNKGTFFINIIGLSSGLACSLLIYLWIRDEWKFDRFHEKKDRLFQVMDNVPNSDGIITKGATPFGMADVLAESIPEIEHAATVTPLNWFPKFIVGTDLKRVKCEGKFVGKEFLKIFSYKLVNGDPNQVLAGRYSIVISEKLAIALFGSAENAIGKTLPWELANIRKECTISGVSADVPPNSSDTFDLLLSIDLLGEIMGFDSGVPGPPGPYTYVTLREGTDPAIFNEKMNRLMRERIADHAGSFFVTPYSENYLYGKFENGVSSGGRIQYVRLFGILGAFILLIACVNFMNLSTAKATARMKEVGIKKSIGASRKILIIQFFAESTSIAILSFALAAGIVQLLLPAFSEITSKNLAFEPDLSAILFFIGITLLTGVVAGSYPALYVSSFKPVTVLKGTLKRTVAEVIARKGLVVFQFTVSMVFIVAVIVTYNQIRFIQERDPGYDKDHIIYFENEGAVANNTESFINELKNIPGVINASSMIGNVIDHFGQPGDIDINGQKLPFNIMRVNYGLIETLGIEMEEGRPFSSEFNDTSRVVINKAAVERLGMPDPVGKTISLFGKQVQIIGVTKNFHVNSFHENIKPLIFQLEASQHWNIMVRIQDGVEDETITRIKNFYRNFNPGLSLDYNYLDQTYERQYVSEKRVASLSAYFGILAIVISCLGLFGLAAYSAERRLKEIAIRKVLGSTAMGIMYLLSADFVKLVLIAIVISIPLSYYILGSWLATFAYAITLDVSFFIVAAFLATTISLLTVAGQALKASFVNPAHCLKGE
jgi:putative ABC transport system permease protein